MAHPILGNAKGPLEYKEFEKLLGLSDYEKEFVETNRAYYEGDHFQRGEGYIGPRPLETSAHYQAMMDLIERGFVSKNIIKELVDRQVAAILGRQPDWNIALRRPPKMVPKKVPDPTFVPDPLDPGKTAPLVDDPNGEMVEAGPSDQEKQLIDEAVAALYLYWDSKKPLAGLKSFLRSRLWGGRGTLRSFVPPKYRNQDGTVRAKDVNEAVERIFIDHPEIEDSAVVTDPETMDDLGVVRYKRGDQDVIEISFIDADGKTFVAVLKDTKPAVGDLNGNGSALQRALEASTPVPTENGDQADDGNAGDVRFRDADLSSPLDLNGRLTHFERRGTPLISPQIRQNNALVNLALTMAGSVLVESGFSELSVTNVEFETEEVPDPKAPGGKSLRPKGIKRGPGVIKNFVGIEQVARDGTTTLANPTIHEKEPTPITTFADGKELGYRNCLEEAHQIHAQIAGDATPSGESRITALADFVMCSLDYKEEVDQAGIWLLETVLGWASNLAGTPGKFNSLRATFDSKIYVGKLTPAEQTALLAQVKDRVRSRQNAMVLLEIDDPKSELEIIAEEDKILNPATDLSIQRQKIGLAIDKRAAEDGSEPDIDDGGSGE